MGQMLRALKLIWLAGSVLFLSSVLAQTAEHSAESIASALRAEQFDRALDLLQAALQEFPNNGQLWTMQGVAYAGRGQRQEALTSFRRALKKLGDYEIKEHELDTKDQAKYGLGAGLSGRRFVRTVKNNPGACAGDGQTTPLRNAASPRQRRSRFSSRISSTFGS